MTASATANDAPSLPVVRLWELPLLAASFEQTVDEVERLVEARRPSYFITANLNYAMLTEREPRLADVNRDAAFIVADGMPLVWYSRWVGKPLPQRVAGSDLIYALARRAAERGWRVFFLGGAPGVAEEAANRLCLLYPGLTIAGVEVPPFRPMTADEHARLVERVRTTEPDLLFVALGQPGGEIWLHENYQALGVPACVQLGASFDFVAGRVPRAPRWLQRLGLEWAYRIWREPRRMLPRYAANAWFLTRAWWRRPSLAASDSAKQPTSDGEPQLTR
jgi:N-acetylglucosaminyldiphosphoundecaprenol N-acetyl-beta-D-mannosaminyltransferase